ncbi:hypothetical protein CYL20_05795 [Pseudomonas palleroniana]|uniref:Uncharacterized protein n=1 Tax=Pseudomonas palleroniana TaxID=191390 RepID=A0A2L1J6I9_9PSED|nr:hypothetical protein CYL20_05795 [Pseudomonas palleroniana]
MRAHQNNELNKMAAIMRIFAGKFQGFADQLLIGGSSRWMDPTTGMIFVPCGWRSASAYC